MDLDKKIDLYTLPDFLSSRFSDRKREELSDDAQLVPELIAAGYKTLNDLNNMLDRTSKAFLGYERKHPPNGFSGRFSDNGVVRISLAIFDKAYRKMIYGAEQEFIEFEDLVVR